MLEGAKQFVGKMSAKPKGFLRSRGATFGKVLIIARREELKDRRQRQKTEK